MKIITLEYGEHFPKFNTSSTIDIHIVSITTVAA